MITDARTEAAIRYREKHRERIRARDRAYQQRRAQERKAVKPPCSCGCGEVSFSGGLAISCYHKQRYQAKGNAVSDKHPGVVPVPVSGWGYLAASTVAGSAGAPR